MKTVTSIGLFNDAVGKRMSVTYSEIDEKTGQIIADNKRIDRVVVDKTILQEIEDVTAFAQEFVEKAE